MRDLRNSQEKMMTGDYLKKFDSQQFKEFQIPTRIGAPDTNKGTAPLDAQEEIPSVDGSKASTTSFTSSDKSTINISSKEDKKYNPETGLKFNQQIPTSARDYAKANKINEEIMSLMSNMVGGVLAIGSLVIIDPNKLNSISDDLDKEFEKKTRQA
jgi:hypothetical protein